MNNPETSQILLYKRTHGWFNLIGQYILCIASNLLPCKFEADLGITAIVKNEAFYMKEWIEFHKLVGVEKFYIYDNESTDNLKEVLQPYIDSNEVIYKFIKGKKVQFKAYQDSIIKNRRKVRMMAFIDIDEFITPKKHSTVTEFIKNIETKINHKIDALGINWLMHGFNGYYSKPEGLVCEKFKKCDFSTDWNKHIKSIVNPRSVVLAYHPHFCVHLFGAKKVNTKGEDICGPFSKPDFDKIIINHYWTKSYEEYLERSKKGKADGCIPIPLEYDEKYLSVDENNSTDRYLNLLKEKVNS